MALGHRMVEPLPSSRTVFSPPPRTVFSPAEPSSRAALSAFSPEATATNTELFQSPPARRTRQAETATVSSEPLSKPIDSELASSASGQSSKSTAAPHQPRPPKAVLSANTSSPAALVQPAITIAAAPAETKRATAVDGAAQPLSADLQHVTLAVGAVLDGKLAAMEARIMAGVEARLSEMEASMREAIRNLHVDVLKQGHQSRVELNTLMTGFAQQTAAMTKQVQEAVREFRGFRDFEPVVTDHEHESEAADGLDAKASTS